MVPKPWRVSGCTTVFCRWKGRKWSKSLGNFVTIHDLLATDVFGGRMWPGEVLRLGMLMTHYREPIDFSRRKLEEAERLLAKFARRAGEASSTGEIDAEVHRDVVGRSQCLRARLGPAE